MPFHNASDHALGNESIPYCSSCTNSDGTLKSYNEVLEATKGYFISAQGIDPDAATRMAETLLKKQPAWK
jgi:hypothetical protein